MMRKAVRSILLAFLSGHCVSCLEVLPSTPEVFDLTQAARNDLERRATVERDVEAARRLSDYYEYSKNDHESAQYWGCLANRLEKEDRVSKGISEARGEGADARR